MQCYSERCATCAYEFGHGMEGKWRRLSGSAQERLRKKLIQELRVVHDCNSEYLLEYYGVFENDVRSVVMCMEYMDVGSLDQISKIYGPIQVDVLDKIAVSIVGGVNYLYSRHRIMHRDVQPANILVNLKGEIKLYNFGMSSQLQHSVAETFVGTATHMSPERIQGDQYTIKSDVWSVGLTLMELATGRFPYVSDGSEEIRPLDLLQWIVLEPSPKLPESDAFPSVMADMIDKCLMKNPKDRPNPRELLNEDTFFVLAKRTPVNMNVWAVDMKDCLQGLHHDNKFISNRSKPDTKSIQNLFELGMKTGDPAILMAYLPFWNSLKRMKQLVAPLGKGVNKSDAHLLCSRCAKTTQDWRTDRVPRQTVEEMAGKFGCPLCRLILDCLPSGLKSSEPTRIENSVSKSKRQERNPNHAVLKVGRQDQFMDSILKTGANFDDSSTGSDLAFQMAAAWMDTCLTKHRNCNDGSQFPLSTLPTRVIDVGSLDTIEDPRLVSGENQRALYFTLSYRWDQSTSASFPTVQSNLSTYQTAIPLKLLPQTMHDAILITKRFGVRYLWIDALCIIQDSKADWDEQAKQMARIYKNSLLTIAAAAGTADRAQGCFQTRTRMQTRPLDIKSLFPCGSSQYVFADRRITQDGARPLSALDARAWVLQEQLLSPRVLSYSNEELYWDCTTLNASETFPNGVPSFYDADWKFPDERLFKEAILGQNNTNISKERFYLSWRKVVEAYTERKMTKEPDKLAALLGLVKEAAVFLDDKLIVGLWEQRLWAELLWWVKDPKKSKRHEAFSAPTWT